MKQGKKMRGGPGGKSGGGSRKPPAWVAYFLKALERTGHARGSAAEAGIDYTTAYGRKRRHEDFAAAWKAALEAHDAAKQRAEEEELETFVQRLKDPSTIGSAGNGPPPRDALGEELVPQNGQLKRVGYGRWSKRKEKIFFDELAATANARRAAAAVGLTKNAVLQRKLRHPLFAAKWEAVVAMGKAAIGLYVVEATNQTFDPKSVETGVDMDEVTPKVTIAEAIRISEQGAKAAREGPNPFEEEAEKISPAEADELRSVVLKKLLRLKDRHDQQRLSEGWIRDEQAGVLVPPGWIRSTPPPDGPDEARPDPRGG